MRKPDGDLLAETVVFLLARSSPREGKIPDGGPRKPALHPSVLTVAED